MSQVSDEQLVRDYRTSGDRGLFQRLYNRYDRELHAYLRRYLGDAEMADDAYQSAFLQVHLKCDSFEEGRRFRPWLYTIATNQAIDARRRNKRHKMVSLDRDGGGEDTYGTMKDLLVDEDSNPEDILLNRESRVEIRALVDELPEKFARVLQLVYYEGMKRQEAADVLSVPVGTVKSRLHHAMNALADAMQKKQSFVA